MRTVAHSYTALNELLQCERRFYFKRLAKVAEPPSPYLCVGNVYHEVLADLWRPAIPMAVRLAEAMRKPDWVMPSDTTQAALEAEIVLNIGRVAILMKQLKPTLVEQFSRGPYCAKLDIVSDTFPLVDNLGNILGWELIRGVLDWKILFSEKAHTRRKRGLSDSMQLALYCLATGTDRAGYVEIPRDVTVPIRTMTSTFTPYQLKRWEAYFREQFAAMDARGSDEKGYRLADPGHPLCCPQWCPYWRLCPGGEKL